jgi:sugar phosphate isomerase/epimerase
MQASRRTFIRNTALLAAGVSLMPKNIFASSRKIEHLGLQLYTVRDAMKADPAGTLKKLSDASIRRIEHANYVDRKFYGYSVTDFKKLLADNGLNMISGHVILMAKYWDANKGDFTDYWKNAVNDAAEAGQRYIISPWLDDNLLHDENAFKAFMEVLNKSGELCKSNGLTFGYHNHNFEFINNFGGIPLYDVMLANTDPTLVAQQLDIGNMFAAGASPMDYILKYPGRFELMHVKDVIKKDDGKYENTLLGKGIIPLKDVLKEARKTGGTTQFIIEQEEYQGMDPIVCSKLDMKVMNKRGY